MKGGESRFEGIKVFFYHSKGMTGLFPCRRLFHVAGMSAHERSLFFPREAFRCIISSNRRKQSGAGSRQSEGCLEEYQETSEDRESPEKTGKGAGNGIRSSLRETSGKK